MDAKHREYCISLGNPYYAKEEAKYEELQTMQQDIKEKDEEYMLKNSNKFTNQTYLAIIIELIKKDRAIYL